MATVAYDSITILDLMDNATYIYYSEDNNGTGADRAPTTRSKYIGIYTGPPFDEEPSKIPEQDWVDKGYWSGWTQYVGPQGEQGKPGSGFNRIITKLRQFTQAQWNLYSSYGHSENWSFQTDENTPESNLSLNSHINIGDTAYIAGVITDRNNISCMLVGTVTEKTSSGIRMTTTNFIVGEKGDKGDKGDGITISETEIRYILSDDGQNPPGEEEEWLESVPKTSQGKHLWTRTRVFYSDKTTTTSYSVSYSGTDGDAGDTYYIDTNQKDILKIYVENEIKYSPVEFTIRVYKKGTSDELQDLNSFKLEYYSFREENEILIYSFKPIGSTHYSYDSDLKTLKFDVEDFLNSAPADLVVFEEEGQLNRLRFTFEKDGKKVYHIFEIKLGFGEDLARFNSNAAGFNASIQNTKLDFSGTGLTIMNGGISIYSKDRYSYFLTSDTARNDQKDYYLSDNDPDSPSFSLAPASMEFNQLTFYERKENDKVFYADDNGNLILKGTVFATGGEFNGTIYADKGKFSGEIEASTGSIGNFLIEGNVIKSVDDSIQLISKEKGQSKIIASNIELGIGAKISNYIDFDEAYIYNPAVNDNKFIEAPGIVLYSTGKLELGSGQNSISLDGPSQTISSSTNSFSITPEKAVFNNIDCTGIFRTTVFEQNKVQSVGGSMIFKPSYKIEGCVYNEEENYIEFILNDNLPEINQSQQVSVTSSTGEDLNYYVMLNSNLTGSLKRKILSTSEKKVRIEYDQELSSVYQSVVSLVYLGQITDIIIAINSGNNKILDSIYGRGLTITSLNRKDGKPDLFLGDLSQLGDSFSGYGLYAENVHLTGSLVTEINEGTYAGINTQVKDTEKIVFWAGASGEGDIVSAPFRVTNTGDIYATKGTFTGAVISDSTIQGANIYTANLYGGTTEKSSALNIYDCTNGIVFWKGREGSTTKSFVIGEDGLGIPIPNEISIDYFIKIENGEVSFIGSSFTADSVIFEGSESKISGLKTLDSHEDGLIIWQNGIKLFEIGSTTQSHASTFCVDNNFEIGGKISYKNNIQGNGYDLYVS